MALTVETTSNAPLVLPAMAESLAGVKRAYSGGDSNDRPPKRMVADNSKEEVVLRILCSSAKIGSVIGKGGSIIRSIREETGARVKIADPVLGVDERVISISGYDDAEKDVSPAQLGLLRVYERTVDPGEETALTESQLKVRLLVPTTQIGCILGKGGSIISKMREDSACQIRVLPKDQLPGCASYTDEVVQVIGEDPSVRKALELIASQLRSNPPKERISVFESRDNILNSQLISPSPHGTQALSKPTSFPHYPYSISALKPVPMSETYPGKLNLIPSPDYAKPTPGRPVEVMFRILCDGNKIGGIIGKAGSIIKQIREETGARIKISDEVTGVPDRIVFISGIEDSSSQFSPAQEALFRIQDRIIEREKGDNPEALFTRILIPKNHIGCLMGKGGSIITEMRKISRASIRLMPKEQVPLCAQEGDEFIQIVGEANANRVALQHVSSRLRFHMLKEQSPDAHTTTPVIPPPYKMEKLNSYAPMVIVENPMLSNLDHELNQSVITVYMPVPLSFVGSIIGRGGSHISQIRTISGSKIRLLTPQEGQTDRLVEIQGSPAQVKAAQDLVNTFIVNSATNANISSATNSTEKPPYSY